MTDEVTTIAIHDEPLREGGKDLLCRQGFVEHLATVIHAAPSDASVVFAVYSPWGSGKSSLIPLLKKELDSKAIHPEIVVFNPWLFSGREKLFQTFFEEVGGTLQSSTEIVTKEVGKKMRKLGMVLSGAGNTISTVNSLLGITGLSIPMGEMIAKAVKGAGSAVEAADKLQEEILQVAPPRAEDFLLELQTAVDASNRPFLIILDDLDRLLPSEAVEMLQLVKAACRVPGIHFLILADHKALCSHLSQQKLDSSYLDKIVQYAVPLPNPPKGRLQNILISGLNGLIASDAKASMPATDEEFEKFVSKYLMPAIRTVRDAKRFLNVVRFSIPLMSHDGFLEVNLEDLLCVLLIHAFDETTYQALARSKQLLAPDIDVQMFFVSAQISRQNKDEKPPHKEWLEKITVSLVEREKDWLCNALDYIVQPNEKRETKRDFEWQRRFISSTHFGTYFRLTRSEDVVPRALLAKICDPKAQFDEIVVMINEAAEIVKIDAVGQQIVARFHDPSQPTPSLSLVAAILNVFENSMMQDAEASADMPYEFLKLYIRRSQSKFEEKLEAILIKSKAVTLMAYCMNTFKNDSEFNSEIVESISSKIAKEAEKMAEARDLTVCHLTWALCEIWRPRCENDRFEIWFTEQTSTPGGLLRMVDAFGRMRSSTVNGREVHRFFQMPSVYLMKYWPEPTTAAESLRTMKERDKPEGDLKVKIDDAQESLKKADGFLRGKEHFTGELEFLLRAQFAGNYPASGGLHAQVGLLLPPITIPPALGEVDPTWAQDLSILPEYQGSTILAVTLEGFPMALEGLAVVGDEKRLWILAASLRVRFFYLFTHESRYVCDVIGEFIHWIDPAYLK
jgi:predicted KAP-like P-loop ATPase